jgi:peroxiredoxin
MTTRFLLFLALVVSVAIDPARAQSTDNLAPEFSLPDAAGNHVTLSDFRGDLVVLNFWATWCGPCRYEMPAFVRLQDRYRDDVRFVGVSVDEAGWSAISPFTKEIGVNYSILWDMDSSTLAAYGDPSALPATYVIDRNGRIQVIIQGMVSESDLEEILLLLLDGVSLS